MIVKMALRNLKRNTRRTIITLVSIAFGLLLSLTFTGIGDSGYTKMINGAAQLGSGHVSIIPTGYLDMPSLDKIVSGIDALIQMILQQKGVTTAVSRITGQAMMATPNDSIGAAFVALDPDRETPDTQYLLKYITEGKIFTADDKHGIVIGKKMAERLKVNLGNKVVYTTTDKHGEITSGLARVTGIFETGADQVDGYFFMLPLRRMQQILGYDSSEATLIAVFLEDHRLAPSMVKTITPFLKNTAAQAVTWRQSMPDMAGFVAMDSSMNYLFQIIIFMLVAAGILNTILMSVLERTREFGIMLAIGFSPGGLIRMVMTETAWLGIFGLLSGLIVTAPLYWYLHFTGLDMSGMVHEGTDVAGVVFDTTIYNDLRLESLLIILTGAFIITLLSGIYPAWKAGRVEPVESIKTI